MKSFIAFFLLTLLFPFITSGQTSDPNIEVSLAAPAYGVNIKANFGEGVNSGWARGYSISNEDGTKKFFAFGSIGDVINGKSSVNYSYIGRDYYDTYMIFQPDGNVGIGTTTPRERLSVNGNIRAREIKVETANWPDYVFRPDYDLKPLAEVSKFIKENGHLPDVPKAAVVEEEGISLGEMNKILLKKVEELTLHLIEIKEELEVLKRSKK